MPARPMPLTDAMFLLAEAREKPMHVGGLQLFSLPDDAGPETVGDLYRASIEHRDVNPRLARKAVRLGGIGPWAWQSDQNLDLEYHVRHSALAHPGRIRELLALTSRLHGTLLHRTRPLWEAHLIEGLADGRFATYTKIHHALVDGVSAMRLLEDGLSTDPEERDIPPPWAPPKKKKERKGTIARSVPDPSKLVSAATDVGKGVVGASAAAVRSVIRSFSEEAAALPYRAPKSPLNVPISGARRFAADSYPLERINAIRGATGATLNDVVMTICGSALRTYLDEMGELPEKPLIAMVPVSLRAGESAAGGNAVGAILCNLATHLPDPADRFDLVRRSMKEGKLQLEGLTQTGLLLISALSFGGIALGPLTRFEPLRRPPFNLIISNVPGPKERLYWNGTEMVGMYPVSIPSDGQALNITVSSYVDSLDFGLIGDRRALPHLQRLLSHLDDSLAELEKVAAV